MKNSKIAIFGIGGVGSYVVEGLARTGIGTFILVDNDKVSLSNLNRQIIATQKTIGKLKVVYSKEEPLKIDTKESISKDKSSKIVPGSISFVPSVAGLIILGEVIKYIVKIEK